VVCVPHPYIAYAPYIYISIILIT